MKKIVYPLIAIVFMFINTLGAFASSNIKTFNPHTQSQWMFNNNATIEKAEITIDPKGAYAEVGFYLTFSARGQSFPANDSLEIQYSFDLPTGSYISDSWLWIDNYISQAQIMDIWTARDIYEGIVKRKQDPSILTKSGANSYLIKIYPMKANASRKVKITALIPFSIKNGIANLELPISNFACSFNVLDSINIFVKNNAVYTNPSIANQASFQTITNKNYGTDYNLNFKNNKTNEKLQFAIPTNQNSFLWLNTGGKEKYYQLVINPSLAFNIGKNKKTLIICDIDSLPKYEKYTYKTNYIQNSSYYYQDYEYTSETNYFWDYNNLQNDLQNMLSSYFQASDSVNLMYAKNGEVALASEKWLPYNTTAVDSFNTKEAYNCSNQSALNKLLHKGIEFVKNNGNNGNIILLTNSMSYSTKTLAKQLLDSLKKSFSTFPQINILNLSSLNKYRTNYSYYYPSTGKTDKRTYVNNSSWSANTEFYNILANLTGGTSLNTSYENSKVPEMLEKIYFCSTKPVTNYELRLTTNAGFNYSTYMLNTGDQNVYPDRMIISTGKYTGSLPITATLTGFYNNEPLSTSITFDQTNTYYSDTTLNTIWGGNAVDAISSYNSYNNYNIQNAVNLSIKHRVLTNYTALLALENNTPIEPCTDCSQTDKEIFFAVESNSPSSEIAITSLKSESKTDTLSVSPNPFEQDLIITVTLSNYKNARIVIYDIMGVEIDQLPLRGINNQAVTVKWSKKDLKKGVYIVTVNSVNGKKSMKVVKR